MSTLVVEVCEVKAVYPHPQGRCAGIHHGQGLAGDRPEGAGTEGRRPGRLLPARQRDAARAGRPAGDHQVPRPPAPGDRRHPQAGPAGPRGPAPRRAQLRDDRPRGRSVLGGRARRPGALRRHQVRAARAAVPTGTPCRRVAAFHGYTEIENIRNFPDVLQPGEEVVITEKLHGKNCRLGLIRVPGEAVTPSSSWPGRTTCGGRRWTPRGGRPTSGGR